jgi:hypothetical protein
MILVCGCGLETWFAVIGLLVGAAFPERVTTLQELPLAAPAPSSSAPLRRWSSYVSGRNWLWSHRMKMASPEKVLTNVAMSIRQRYPVAFDSGILGESNETCWCHPENQSFVGDAG